MAKRLTKKLRADIMAAAQENTKYYCVALDLDESKIQRGEKHHIDPNLNPTPGYWVAAWVFVADEDVV